MIVVPFNLNVSTSSNDSLENLGTYPYIRSSYELVPESPLFKTNVLDVSEGGG